MFPTGYNTAGKAAKPRPASVRQWETHSVSPVESREAGHTSPSREPPGGAGPPPGDEHRVDPPTQRALESQGVCPWSSLLTDGGTGVIFSL